MRRAPIALLLALTGCAAQCPAGYICRDADACQQDSDCGDPPAGEAWLCLGEPPVDGGAHAGAIAGCYLSTADGGAS